MRYFVGKVELGRASTVPICWGTLVNKIVMLVEFGLNAVKDHGLFCNVDGLDTGGNHKQGLVKHNSSCHLQFFDPNVGTKMEPFEYPE